MVQLKMIYKLLAEYCAYHNNLMNYYKVNKRQYEDKMLSQHSRFPRMVSLKCQCFLFPQIKFYTDILHHVLVSSKFE